jgi:putative tryptophan/tyrosine transport system permease protein
MTFDLIITGLLQGLVLSIVAYGIMIPFRFLNFPDLTAEGAYPLGGAICASLLFGGQSPLFAIILAAISAGIISIATGLVNLKLKVNSLLAGIIISTMAYSINLRIMGKPNISLFDSNSLFSNDIKINIILLVLIIIATIIPLAIFLHTELGLRLRAVGLNADFATKNGISVTKYTLIGLFIAGCYTGIAGGLMVQLQSYMDIGMGVGIVIHALAALMIGEKIIGNDSLKKQLIAPLIGAIIYQQMQGIAIAIGLAPSDLKLFTGILVLIVIAVKNKPQYSNI